LNRGFYELESITTAAAEDDVVLGALRFNQAWRLVLVAFERGYSRMKA